MTEFGRQPETKQPHPTTMLLQMIGRTTVLVCQKTLDKLPITPEQPAAIHRIMEEDMINFPQPLQPNLYTTIVGVQGVVEHHAVTSPKNPSFSEKITHSLRLLQFTDQFASEKDAFLDYGNIKALKDRFTSYASEQSYPLSFSQQLDIALDVSDGDIIDALQNLVFASRQYARWFDSVSIRNIPNFTNEEALTEMKEWRESILACKNPDRDNFQDPSGDTYYAWTHALGAVMYGTGGSLPDFVGKYVSSRGTDLMHGIVHKIAKQSAPNSHNNAATYGNHIGGAILDAIDMTESR